MIKYKTRSNAIKIEEVEISRETDASVFIMRRDGSERREAKSSEWCQYHDSFEQARNALIYRVKLNIDLATSSLERLSAELESLNSM